MNSIVRVFSKGILVMLPFIILAWMLSFIYGIFSGLVSALFNTTASNTFATVAILVSVLIFILYVGYEFERKQASFFVKIFEFLVSKIPMVGSVYSVLKDMVSMFSGGSEGKYLGVVYVRIGEVKALGFITHADGDCYCVFVPTTPNPTSGFLLNVHKDDIEKSDMSVSDGLKRVLSLGINKHKGNY